MARPSYQSGGGSRGRRPPPPGRLDFLKGFFRPLTTRRRRIKRKFKSAGALNTYRLIIVVLAAVAITALIAGIVAFAGRNNAYEVYVADTRAGIIKLNKKITAEMLENIAVNKIENDIGMRIEANEKITINPVRASDKNIITEENVIAAIASTLTYKVEAAVITIDGETAACLKNIQEAEIIRENLLASYVQEDSNIILREFIEDFEITSIFIDIKELIDSDRAYKILTATTGTEDVHTVKRGDTLWQIALETGMSMDELYAFNPGLTQNLQVGQKIVIELQKPILSIRTLEEVKYTEVIPKSVEYLQNNTQPRTYSRVIQQGRDGQQDVVSHIERVNGFTVDKKIIDYIITIPAVNDIIETGTR